MVLVSIAKIKTKNCRYVVVETCNGTIHEREYKMGNFNKMTTYEANGQIFNVFDGGMKEITDRPELAFFKGGKCLTACDPDWK